ncbi:hypothetical protein [Priestia megaterium]|uniref:hypothetical protein n=1 Tax=Priestia megaterium TaxID=1404 RepID=UPI0011A3B871|nr:hypothetical protein [Priestia megaterium]
MSPEVAAALWTGGITVFGSALTLILTNNHNKKTLNSQLKHQSETLSAEHKHQKNLSIIQHSLDKRTQVVLEFRKILEEAIGILNYFHTEKADFERRSVLNCLYKNPQASPQVRDDIVRKSILEDSRNSMLDHALQQISPIEEKLLPLEVSFNLMSVYLSEEEEKLFYNVVKEVRGFSHIIINGIRSCRKSGVLMNEQALSYVHIDEPFTHRLDQLNKNVKEVRSITKRYVYVDKLDE